MEKNYDFLKVPKTAAGLRVTGKTKWFDLQDAVLTSERHDSRVFAVALHDVVPDGVLVRQVLVVQEVLPALRLIEVSDLG